MHEKVPFKESFYKSQIVSITSSVMDYLVFFLVKELLSMHYAYASVLGNIVGAIVNFMLGRHWSFRRTNGRFTGQAFRYCMVSGSSALLNYWGIIILVEHFGMVDNLAKVVIAIIVGIFWNFPLFRYFVFK